RDLIKEYESQPRLSGVFAAPSSLSQSYPPITAQHQSGVAVTGPQSVMTAPGGYPSGPVSAITQPSAGSNRRMVLIGAIAVAALIAVVLYVVISLRQSKSRKR